MKTWHIVIWAHECDLLYGKKREVLLKLDT